MISYIALDIYGTILATDDPDWELKPRKGALKLLKNCQMMGLEVIAASDASVDGVRLELQEKGLLSYFKDIRQLIETPKEFQRLVDNYDISPHQLIVIGDNPKKDIQGAKDFGASYICIEEYVGYDTNKPLIDSIKDHNLYCGLILDLFA